MSENLISYEQLKEKIDYLLKQGEKITNNDSEDTLLSISAFNFSCKRYLVVAHYYDEEYKAYLGGKPLFIKKADIKKIFTFLIDEYKKQELKEYNEITLKEFEKIGK